MKQISINFSKFKIIIKLLIILIMLHISAVQISLNATKARPTIY